MTDPSIIRTNLDNFLTLIKALAENACADEEFQRVFADFIRQHWDGEPAAWKWAVLLRALQYAPPSCYKFVEKMLLRRGHKRAYIHRRFLESPWLPEAIQHEYVICLSRGSVYRTRGGSESQKIALGAPYKIPLLLTSEKLCKVVSFICWSIKDVRLIKGLPSKAEFETRTIDSLLRGDAGLRWLYERAAEDRDYLETHGTGRMDFLGTLKQAL